MRWIYDIVSLFFPNICNSCDSVLYQNEDIICSRCLLTLPKTKFHYHQQNPVTEIFDGRLTIESAAAFLYYSKGGRVQHMIHNFKYKKNLELGRLLGRLFGNDLRKSSLFNNVEAVIPIPLHESKQKLRGFNQSEVFGRELAAVLKIDFLADVLIREKVTTTQTRKSRFERWKNVDDVFRVTQPEKIRGRHILLVDDVVTTGATVEAAGLTLLDVPDVTISLAFLAVASH